MPGSSNKSEGVSLGCYSCSLVLQAETGKRRKVECPAMGQKRTSSGAKFGEFVEPEFIVWSPMQHKCDMRTLTSINSTLLVSFLI